MYRPTVYETKLNEIIVNSNEPMQSATGSTPTAHRQTKEEVGRSGNVLSSSNVTITERYVANIIKKKNSRKEKRQTNAVTVRTYDSNGRVICRRIESCGMFNRVGS
jgi:hypothetical protein